MPPFFECKNTQKEKDWENKNYLINHRLPCIFGLFIVYLTHEDVSSVTAGTLPVLCDAVWLVP